LILATAEGQQAIELRPINSLGRHPNNSIQLLDKIVSKEHCILEQRDGGFVLRDLGSLNGTFVNGERVRGELMLRHGDEIALGSTRARYDDGRGPPLDFNAPIFHGGAVAPHVSPGAIQHAHPSPLAKGGVPVPTPWGGPNLPSVPPSSHGVPTHPHGHPRGPMPSAQPPGSMHGPGMHAGANMPPARPPYGSSPFGHPPHGPPPAAPYGHPPPYPGPPGPRRPPSF